MDERDRRASIIYLYLQGDSPSTIIRKLKLTRTQRATVYNVIKSYKVRGTFERKKRASRKSQAGRAAGKNIRDKIRRNPQRSQRKLAAEHGTSVMTINRILREDLHVKPYKSRRRRMYLAGGQAERLRRLKLLKSRLAAYDPKTVIFSDEKIFRLELVASSQNRRVYGVSLQDISSDDLYVGTSQKSPGVMVFAAISGSGVCQLAFVDPGAKVDQVYYREKILRAVVLPWVQRTFSRVPYIFQQDGAPSHTAKTVQAFCMENFYDFLRSKEWPAASPDMNPCDFYLWGWLEGEVNRKNYSSVTQLKAALVKAWSRIDLGVVESACVNAFKKRLSLAIREKGGPIEHLL